MAEICEDCDSPIISRCKCGGPGHEAELAAARKVVEAARNVRHEQPASFVFLNRALSDYEKTIEEPGMPGWIISEGKNRT